VVSACDGLLFTKRIFHVCRPFRSRYAA
jgi:hypothetical protein